MPKCYKSECRQRYRYDTLLVFDPCDAKRAPMLELFKIPDGCECFVLVEEPELGDDSAVSASVTKRQPPTSATVPPSTLSTTVPTASGRSGDFTTAAITTQFTTPKTTVAATTIASTSKTSSATTDQTSAPKQIIILSPRVRLFRLLCRNYATNILQWAGPTLRIYNQQENNLHDPSKSVYPSTVRLMRLSLI